MAVADVDELSLPALGSMRSTSSSLSGRILQHNGSTQSSEPFCQVTAIPALQIIQGRRYTVSDWKDRYSRQSTFIGAGFMSELRTKRPLAFAEGRLQKSRPGAALWRFAGNARLSRWLKTLNGLTPCEYIDSS